MTNQEFLESIAFFGEVWKDVVGYEHLYFVSSLGRVASTNYLNHGKQQLLHPCVQKSRNKEYSYVCLTKNKKSKKIRVHRLVAEAFIENANGYNEIDHIDGDGTNNKVENLRWCSRGQNMNNPITKIRLSHYKKFPLCTHVGSSIEQIKDGFIIAIYERLRDVEKDGFIPTAVCAVCRGRAKTHKGYEWRYHELNFNDIKNTNDYC